MEGEGTTSPSIDAMLMGQNPPVTDSKPEPQGQAPAGGQPDAAQKQTSTEPDPSQKAQEPEIKDDDIARLLSADEAPEHKLKRLERDYAASSKEAKRLNAAYKRVSELLKEQGVDLVEEDGLPAGFLAKGKGKDGEFSLNFKELSEEEQGLFEDNPQKAINLVLEKARRGFVRVQPTVDRAAPFLTTERKNDAINHVKSMVWEDGSKKYPSFEKAQKFIDQTINTGSKALKEFAAQEPELAYELLALRVEKVMDFLSTRAKAAQQAKETKKQQSQETPPFGPYGGGVPGMSQDDAANLSGQVGKAIASAGMGY